MTPYTKTSVLFDMKYRIQFVAWLLALGWVTVPVTAGTAIDAERHDLWADTPGQTIDLFVSGDAQVTGFNLRARIGDAEDERLQPVFTAVDFDGGIWDAHAWTIMGGSLVTDQWAQVSMAFDASVTVPAAGHLARLTVDTTGIATGNSFALRLAGTGIGADTDLVTIGGQIIEPLLVEGIINIVPVGTERARVSVAAQPLQGGTVSGGGNYAHGSSATVAAAVHPWFVFVNWTENGAIVSDDPDYAFIVERPRELTANFFQTTFPLCYTAGAGGFIQGPGMQLVSRDDDGEEVTAWADAGAEFVEWSDGVPTAARRDLNVTESIAVVARFRSVGGVDIDWYAGHGIEPGAGQDWSDLDVLDFRGKGLTLRQEFIAGTDPNDPRSLFDVAISSFISDKITLTWRGLPQRRYRVYRRDCLFAGDWLLAAEILPMEDGTVTYSDTDSNVTSRFYRLDVTKE